MAIGNYFAMHRNTGAWPSNTPTTRHTHVVPCLRCDTVTMVRTVACKRGYKASLLRMGRIRLVVSYPKDGVFLEHEFVFQRVRASKQ